MRVQAGGWINK